MTKISPTELRKIASLRQEIIKMLERVKDMFHTNFDGLMKNDIRILDGVLKDEALVNEAYTDLTARAIDITKKKLPDETKRTILDLVNVIGAIEKMGDLCVDLVERIEYKVNENLLFSDVAVQEYKELCDKIEAILGETIVAVKNRDRGLLKKIVKNRSSLYALIEKSRVNHINRSAKGICEEWAKVRYLDMLDFIKTIVDHCMETAEKLT